MPRSKNASKHKGARRAPTQSPPGRSMTGGAARRERRIGNLVELPEDLPRPIKTLKPITMEAIQSAVEAGRR